MLIRTTIVSSSVGQVLPRLSRVGEQGAAALLRAAIALVELLVLLVVRLFQDEPVVVGQLLARLDVAQRLDEDAALFDHRLAVRLARVVDEAGDIAAAGRIDDGARADAEQEGVLRLIFVERVAAIGLRVRDAFTDVFNDALALRDGLGRDDAAAVDTRVHNLERVATRTVTRG